MKNLVYLLLLITSFALAQQPYYNNVDLTLTGQDLYFELQNKIDNASSTFNYGDVRDAVKITDEDPNNINNVLLVYGYNDTDGDCTTDRTRDKDDFGGMSCEYNREHVFARSNANPEMGNASNGTTGIAADPHNLRPSDQQMNGNKGSRKFTNGSGNAVEVGGDEWYPGDEWKGDVARMMMYMYTRYGDRCLPSLQGTGPTEGSTDMLQLYLQWNVEDPVSAFEDQRNPYLENVYGNRNPFIDNPVLATIIWGGPLAEDRWGLLNTSSIVLNDLLIYPNPTSSVINVQFETTFQTSTLSLFDMTGREVFTTTTERKNTPIDLSYLSRGMYILNVENNGGKLTKKIQIR